MERASFLIPDSLTKIIQPTPGSQRCPVHGQEVPDELITFGARQLRVPGTCPACEGDKRRMGDAPTVDERLAAKLEARRRMGVPELYLGAQLESFQVRNEPQQVVATAIHEFVAGGWRRSPGMLFTGNVGTAKTMLGAALVNHWLDTHGSGSARFYTFLGLMRRIKSTWNPESYETEAMALQRLKDLSLLVVDEIGVQFGSAAEAALFTDLVNERYNSLRPTVLITNLSVTDCYEALGDRIMDRLRDGGRALAFSWESWRGKQRD